MIKTLIAMAAFAILMTSAIKNTPANSYRVKRVLTPIGKIELAAVLRDGHYAVFGTFPSKKKLAVAWAQVALENGQGKKTFNHNLGKITSGKDRPYYIQRHRFRAHNNFNQGAEDYWRVVKKLCSRSLPFFEKGDPYSAALVLRSCGYYQADKHRYGLAMVKLYRLASKELIPLL